MKYLCSIAFSANVQMTSFFCPKDNNKPGRFSNKKKGHSGGFYQKYGHFWPAFHNKIDESFLKFFSLTLVLLDSILLLVV